MLVQEIANFLRRTDDYQLDPDVEAFLLRDVKAYYQQNGLEVCRSVRRTLGFLVRVQIMISGPREGTRLCSSPNSGIDERFEDLDLDFELI